MARVTLQGPGKWAVAPLPLWMAPVAQRLLRLWPTGPLLWFLLITQPNHQFPSDPICQPIPFQNKAFLLKSAPSVSAACKLNTWETERGNGKHTVVWHPVRWLRSKTGSGQYFVDLRTKIQMQMWRTVSRSYWVVKRKMCVYHSLDFSRSIHFQRMKYGTFLEFPGGLGRFRIFGRIQACLGYIVWNCSRNTMGLRTKCTNSQC